MEKSWIMTVYNFPENIDLTSIFRHKSCDLHNIILNLYFFTTKYEFHIVHSEINSCKIENLNIKWYNFEISQKGTIGNLYRIVSNGMYRLFWPRTVKFSKTDTIIIDIEIVITKTDTIISEIDITYVYNLAHACTSLFHFKKVLYVLLEIFFWKFCSLCFIFQLMLFQVSRTSRRQYGQIS